MARGGKDIRVGIDYSGTEDGGSQLDGLIERLERLDGKQAQAARSARRLEQQSTATSTATIAHQQSLMLLGSTIGQVGSTLSRINPKFSRLGGTISSLGASIPALTGALGPVAQAISAVTLVVDLGTQAWDAYTGRAADDVEAQEARRRANVRLSQSFGTLLSRIRATASARETAARLARGVGTEQEFEAQAQRFENRAAQLRNELRTHVSGLSAAQSTARLVRLGSQLRRARREAARAREALQRGAEHGFIVEETSSIDFDPPPPEQDPPPRGGRGRGSSAKDRDIAVARKERARVDAARAAAEELERIREEAAAAEDERAQHAVDEAMRVEEERIASEERIAQAAVEASEKAAEARRAAEEEAQADRRKTLTEVGATLTSITQAVSGAFEAAISGEQSLEEALLAATKVMLKQLGTQLVAKGIGHILDGIAELPSPTAAPKIAGGIAMTAFGVGLGAAAAAIPSAPAGGEAPREEPQQQSSGGPRTLVLNVNNPVMSAATHAQLARGLHRQMSEDRTFGAAA